MAKALPVQRGHSLVPLACHRTPMCLTSSCKKLCPGRALICKLFFLLWLDCVFIPLFLWIFPQDWAQMGINTFLFQGYLLPLNESNGKKTHAAPRKWSSKKCEEREPADNGQGIIVSPQIYRLKSNTPYPVPQNGAVFRDRILKEVS